VPLPRAFPALSGLAPKKDCPFPRKSRTSRNLRGPEAKFVRTLAPDRRDALARDISVTRAWARARYRKVDLSLRGQVAGGGGRRRRLAAGEARLLNKSPPSRRLQRWLRELEWRARCVARDEAPRRGLYRISGARVPEISRDLDGESHPEAIGLRSCYPLCADAHRPASKSNFGRRSAGPNK